MARTILIAPDSFKGSLTAFEAASAMERGVHRADPAAATILHPIADGGEGLVNVVTPALDGRIMTTRVTGPLPGQQVEAHWGLSGDGSIAVIEMAEAAGLPLVPPGRRDPKGTTTFGVGELIRAALDQGVATILVGIGGSATNDAGAGMAEALGFRFLDNEGCPIARGGAALANLARIDPSGKDARLGKVIIQVACDVQNLLCGTEGASAVYGPQKGASASDVDLLDAALRTLGETVRTSMGIDVFNVPGGGAAGGLGAGMIAFCGATLKRGIDLVLTMTEFDEHLGAADLVITGEGKIDAQVLFGKALSGVVQHSLRSGVPVVAVVGVIGGHREMFINEEFFADLESLVGPETSMEEALRNAAPLLERRTELLLQRYLNRT